MERFFPLLRTLECDEQGMSLTFKDGSTLNQARTIWDWVDGEDDNHFVMVAGAGDCGWNDERQPYLIRSLQYDGVSNTVHLIGEQRHWKSIIHSYDFVLGHIPERSQDRLVSRQTDNDMAIKFDTDAPFASEFKSFGLGGKLECVKCSTTGDFNLEFRTSTKYNVPVAAVISLAPQNVKLTAILKLSLFGELSNRYEKRWRLKLPTPASIYIPNLVNIGPALDFLYSVALTEIKAQAVIQKGGSVTIDDDSLMKIDLLNPIATEIRGWSLKFEDVPWRLDARMTASIETFVGPAFGVNAEILGMTARALPRSIICCRIVDKLRWR